MGHGVTLNPIPSPKITTTPDPHTWLVKDDGKQKCQKVHKRFSLGPEPCQFQKVVPDLTDQGTRLYIVRLCEKRRIWGSKGDLDGVTYDGWNKKFVDFKESENITWGSKGEPTFKCNS